MIEVFRQVKGEMLLTVRQLNKDAFYFSLQDSTQRVGIEIGRGNLEHILGKNEQPLAPPQDDVKILALEFAELKSMFHMERRSHEADITNLQSQIKCLQQTYYGELYEHTPDA